MELDPLLTDVEVFLADTGMAPTVFGLAVLRDPRFVPELRRGRELRRRTVERVREQMAHYRSHGKFMNSQINTQTNTGRVYVPEPFTSELKAIRKIFIKMRRAGLLTEPFASDVIVLNHNQWPISDIIQLLKRGDKHGKDTQGQG